MKEIKQRFLSQTHTRILGLLCMLGILFLAMFLVISELNRKHRNMLKEDYHNQLVNSVNTSLELKYGEVDRVVYDYTYWDDLVDHLARQDNAWYDENIATIVSSFRFDFVGVLNLDGSFSYYSGDSSLSASVLMPDALLPKLYRDRFLNYFISTPQGIARVSTATIHPTSDPDRKTEPAGYMFLGRIWNNRVLSDLEKTTGASVAIDFEKPGDTMMASFSQIILNKPLMAWDGYITAHLVFTRDFSFIRIFRTYMRHTFTLILVFVLSSLALIFWASRRWVGKPLRAVSKILEQGDRGQIDHLKHLKTEFREIGELFEKFLDQSAELEKAKIQAEEADRLKTAFLANMSHEIRTPMNGILGFAELLRDPELTTKERLAFIDIIIRSGKNLLTIINDIIDISKIEAGLMTIDLTACNLNQVINENLNFFSKHELVLKKELELKCRKQFADESANMVSDPVRLNQILTNLIGNAVKFTASGYIEVGYRLQDSYTLLLYVKDTGIGIPADKQNAIFDRFIQADNSHTRQFEGTGLGLAITKALVDLMHGQLWVESTTGEGSTFYISLPYIPIEAKAEILELPVSSDRVPDYTGKTILVAEDVEDNFHFFKSVLQKTNARVVWVKNGREAVDKALSGRPPDLILMDLRMPVMNGYDATREIKKQKPQIPIIAQTAYSLDGDRSKSMDAGCDEYIAKPIDIQQLYHLIDRFIGTFGI